MYFLLLWYLLPMALLRCSWLGWGIRKPPGDPQLNLSGPLQLLLSEPTGSCDSSRGRVQHECAGRTPDKPVSAPESLNHVEHGDCSGESGKGRRWCFSTVIKINRAADAVCAAVSVADELNYFIFTQWELTPPPLLEGGRLWLTKSQRFESFYRKVIIYGTVWTYPCWDI